MKESASLIPVTIIFQALQSLLENLNADMLKSSLPPISTAVALKFLMARKFDVSRASKLFKQHLEVRAKYKMAEMKPLDEPLSKELLSEKLTILVSNLGLIFTLNWTIYLSSFIPFL